LNFRITYLAAPGQPYAGICAPLTIIAMRSGTPHAFLPQATTIAGIELAHRIRKRQYSFGRGRHGPNVSLKQLWDRALA